MQQIDRGPYEVLHLLIGCFYQVSHIVNFLFETTQFRCENFSLLEHVVTTTPRQVKNQASVITCLTKIAALLYYIGYRYLMDMVIGYPGYYVFVPLQMQVLYQANKLQFTNSKLPWVLQNKAHQQNPVGLEWHFFFFFILPLIPNT